MFDVLCYRFRVGRPKFERGEVECSAELVESQNAKDKAKVHKKCEWKPGEWAMSLLLREMEQIRTRELERPFYTCALSTG